MEDCLQDRSFHALIWNIYLVKSNPSARMEGPIPEIDPEVLKVRLERCQRMEDKKDQINRDKINDLRQRVQWHKENFARDIEWKRRQKEVNSGLQDGEQEQQQDLVDEEPEDEMVDDEDDVYVPVHLHREEDLMLPYGMTLAEWKDIFGERL
jgi:hypothetical protein